MTQDFTILGVPGNSAGSPGGCELSPMVLRQHGLLGAANASRDLNDLPVRIAGTRDAQSGIVGYESVLKMTGRPRRLVIVLICHLSFLMGLSPLELAEAMRTSKPIDLCDAAIAQTPSSVGEVVRQRMEKEPSRFWIHLDFDVLHDLVFPAVDYFSGGGLARLL